MIRPGLERIDALSSHVFQDLMVCVSTKHSLKNLTDRRDEPSKILNSVPGGGLGIFINRDQRSIILGFEF